jgi:hypothetical protein
MPCTVQRSDDQTDRIKGLSCLLSWGLRVSALFAIVAACLTYDEVRFPASIPLKSTDVATVPLFNVWTIGWNADRAMHGLRGYWAAPIFFPAERAFAFSEPQPATLLVAPLVWVTGSAVAGYKGWLFLSLFLNGFFTALLLRRFGYAWFLQAAGGTAMTLLPVIHQRIDVLQLVPVWGILWFWSCLFELARNPRPRCSIETGFSFAVCFALCVHHALFLSLLIPFAGLVFVPELKNRRFLLGTLGAVTTGVILVLPIVLPIRAAAEANGFSREERTVKSQSAKPEQYLAAQSNAILQWDRFEGPESRQFNVGWFRMLLAVVGATSGLLWGQRRRWLLFLLLTGTLAMTFSLGLNLDLFGWRPWQTLSENLPGVGQVRNVYRFAWFVQMAIVLLAVEGLAALQVICQRWFAVSFRKTALAVLVVMPGLLLAGEVWPKAAQRGGVPDVASHSGWTRFIRDNRTVGRPIVCLPFASGNSISDFDMTTRWMCYGLEHGAPMINGYSGFFPQSYLELRNFVNDRFPSTQVVERLAKLDAEYLVVARRYCPSDTLLALSTKTLRVELVYQDPVGVDVYRLVAADEAGSTQAIR